MAPPRRRFEWFDQRGIALVAVLGFLAVMSLIAVAIVGASRASVTGSSRHLLRVQAQAAVESAVNGAIVQLLLPREAADSGALFQRHRVRYGGFSVSVAVRPERTKVDINHADANLLSILFRAAGATVEQAQALAAGVLDWRDGDELIHIHGAERRQYAEAGLDYGPANKPFESIEDLRLVLGVSAAIFDCVRPEITIFTQRPGIDIDRAAPMIRRAAGLEDPPSALAAPEIGPGEAFEIEARIDDRARNLRRAERAVVRITGNPLDPYWILAAEPAFPSEDAARRSCPRDDFR